MVSSVTMVVKQIEEFLLKDDFPWFYVNSGSGDSKMKRIYRHCSI